MATVTVKEVQHRGGTRTIQIRVDNGDFGFSADVDDADRIPESHLQAIIDGDAPDGGFVSSGLRYIAKNDRLEFAVIGREGWDKNTISIARELIASELATAVGLRQPPSQDVKPAKT